MYEYKLHYEVCILYYKVYNTVLYVIINCIKNNIILLFS